MAVSTDPLNRASIAVTARDTGDRYQGQKDNSALRLARALGDIQPALNQTMQAIAEQDKSSEEAKAKAAALEASGAPLADAVRLGKIKATQNPWFVDAYERESAAIRGQDTLSKLQTESLGWEERSDPGAFAKRWREEVGKVTEGFDGNENAIKGFSAAEAQATQQVLATNQAYNSARILGERKDNISILASDALRKAVQAGGGHISGSAAAAAMEPAKQQWIATGGTLEDWNKLTISAVTTASYSIRSPGLLDLLKDPALLNGPREDDTSSYGDGTESSHPDTPAPLQPVIAPEAAGPSVSTAPGMRLQPPAMGKTVPGGTYAAHVARRSHGVDIAGPVGTKITTPISGIVKVGHDAKSGLFVAVQGDDGKLYTSFSHLSLAAVQPGQRVSAGEVVGRMGQSGHATGPHVHWRLKVDGKDVDPTTYRVEQASDDQQAKVAAGEAAPELAPADAQSAPTVATVTGPSLYDIAGVADQVESDRYRIKASVNSEAGDRLQAITNERRLQGLEATDRLYSTFGTRILTGDVSGDTVIGTLQKAGYSPQVIREAINNVQSAVADSQGLSNARLGLQGNDPAQAKKVFDLATEGRTKGYSEDYEKRVGDAILRGEITGSEGTQMVGAAVSRTESIAAAERAETNFNDRHSGTAGTIIKRASDLNKGLDSYAALATSKAMQLSGRALGPKTAALFKGHIRNVVLTYLANHPGDFAGAEQTARDWVASYLRTLQARKERSKSQPQQQRPAASASGNPRR